MALTANREVDHYVDQELRSYQVAAAKNVFKGSFVGLSDAGYAQPLATGDLFLGIAYEESDNRSGANGDVTVRVFTVGDFGLTLSGATVADIGSPVYASDDAAVTFDPTQGHTYMGHIQDIVTRDEIILRLRTCARSVRPA